MTSPAITQAAASTRTEQEVRDARSAAPSLEMPIKVPAINVCPRCNCHPAIDPSFHGKVCIYCDSDECVDWDVQAMGATLKEAAALWNACEAGSFRTEARKKVEAVS